jgi:hypothetical protein
MPFDDLTFSHENPSRAGGSPKRDDPLLAGRPPFGSHSARADSGAKLGGVLVDASRCLSNLQPCSLGKPFVCRQ